MEVSKKSNKTKNLNGGKDVKQGENKVLHHSSV